MALLARRFVALLCLVTLAACGGGGGGRQPSPMSSTTTLFEPDRTMRQKKPDLMRPDRQKSMTNTGLQGTPSTEKAAKTALAKLRESGGILFELNNRQTDRQTFCYFDIFLGQVCPTLSDAISTLSEDTPSIATTDTKAADAWKQGWTGKGVKVAIVDDYRAKSRSVAHGVSTRGVVAQIAPEATFVAIQLDLPNSRDDLLVKAYSDAERNGAHIVNSSFSINPLKNGDIITRERVRREVERELATASFQKAMLPAASPASFNANMLFIYSAGNHAEKCFLPGATPSDFFHFDKSLSGCSIEGKALLKLRETEKDAGDRAIFVGALDDNTTTLARYSLSAGALKNDFIVAHDDIYRAHDGRGTSFAAPRVAGAAALVRHKFPSLNGPNLKQVMLRSADDLGEKGPDEIYGHGKLNVLSALSPIDGLTK
ncbi:MAG: Serotype-specific antigen 1 [Alphaproteobacteria bacterium]|nr:MAG: Serotype-specific antigen 1 [Alphaproteobacteria bacterium]